jgi:ribose transport system substrate-binding protein
MLGIYCRKKLNTKGGIDMRARWQIALAFAGVVSAGLVGPASAEDKPLTIGISHLSLGFPYAVALQKGVQKAAKELGVKLIEFDAHTNALTQANDIDKLIAQHVDGIIFDPIDSVAGQDWADKAKAAGIPIVALAVFVGDARKHPPTWIYPALLAYADRDDVAQAYAIGKLAVADNPNGAKIAIVEGFPGFAAVEFRTQGFEKALKETKANFEVVAKQAGNWDPERAHQICQDALQAHPDISIIFSHDQAMARGCLPALKAAKSKAKIYAIDSSKDVEDLIRDGEPIVTTCANPVTSGEQAMNVLVNYIRTKQTPPDRFVTYKWDTVRRDNVDTCPPQF